MADTVDSVTIIDGPRHVVVRRTAVSDGTGESAAVAVDISTLSAHPHLGAPTHLRVDKIDYQANGYTNILLAFDADTDDEIAYLQGSDTGCIDWRDVGGLTDPETPGSTGDIVLTTTGHTSGDTYTITLHCVKKYG